MSEETNEPKEEVSSAAEAKDDKKEEKKSSGASKEVTKLVDEIKKLKLTEVSELVSALEEEFGVSAAMPMMAAGAAAPAAGGADAGAGDEEKSSYNVELTGAGENKISVIKAIREVIPELGLKEAKDLADGAPKMIKEDVKKEDAENMKKKIEEAGGKVTLK